MTKFVGIVAEKEIKNEEMLEVIADSSVQIERSLNKLMQKYLEASEQISKATSKLSAQFYDLAETIEKQEKLENIRVFTSFSISDFKFVDDSPFLESGLCAGVFSLESYNETVIIAELHEGEFHWRAIQTVGEYSTSIGSLSSNNYQQQVHSSVLSKFAKDNYSHFQNCPLPPIQWVNSIHSTQKKTKNLLMGGCPGRINRFELKLATKKGGSIWINLTKYLRSVPRYYRQRLKNFMFDFRKSLIWCMSKSKTIQKLLKKQLLSYSISVQKLLKETIGELSTKVFYYSFFLDVMGEIRPSESRCDVN